MHALSLAIQMSYVKITSSSFLGLPVTNVSVFLPALLAAIIPRVDAYFSRRRTRGMIRAKEDAKRTGGCVGDFCSCHCASVCPGRLSAEKWVRTLTSEPP